MNVVAAPPSPRSGTLQRPSLAGVTTTVTCPGCERPLLRDGRWVTCGDHAWTAAGFAAAYPTASPPDALELVDRQDTLAVTVNGAWMVRRPRGRDVGWVIDLAGQANSDDLELLHRRAAEQLDALFDTPQDAVDALRAALDDQIRVGQVWRQADGGELVQVVRIDHWGAGPDGTVYVQSLERDAGWSPGDFRRRHTRIADCV